MQCGKINPFCLKLSSFVNARAGTRRILGLYCRCSGAQLVLSLARWLADPLETTLVHLETKVSHLCCKSMVKVRC